MACYFEQMESFEDLLLYYDQRLVSSLDQQYLEEERRFAKERHVATKLPRDVPPVDPGPRQRQVVYIVYVMHTDLGSLELPLFGIT